MKYKDFKSALKFLEEYGFEYGLDSITNKRSCYRNFYGEIVLEYYRLDPNYYIPQIYIEINGWKNKINIEEEYKIISNKKFVGFYTKVHEVIKLELETNFKIYDLIVDSKYLSKLTEVFEYIYPYNKNHLLNNLKKQAFKNDLLRIINDDMFFVPVESNHSGGLWYVANINEENDITKITGKIVVNPDDKGNQSKKPYTKKQKIKDTFMIIFGFILFWWVLLFVFIITGILQIFNKKENENKEVTPKTRTSKLDNFMINKLGCKRINTVVFKTFGQIKNTKTDIDYTLFEEELINCIKSSKIQSYLRENIDSLNILQLATLIMENETNKLKLFKFLKEIVESEYERKLLSIAIKDIKKHKYDDKKTGKFYEKHDPRINRPNCPFSEFIPFPIIFKQYDIALYKESKENNLVVIYKTLNTEIYNNDYDDCCYLAYDLSAFDLINEDKLFKAHCHPHACNLEIVDEKYLTQKQKEQYNDIVNYLKNKEK